MRRKSKPTFDERWCSISGGTEASSLRRLRPVTSFVARRVRWLGAALLPALFMAMAGGAATGERGSARNHRNEDAPPSPHWRADGCTVCHQGDSDGYTPVPRERVDGLCLSCHDGRRASRERHPIGRTFDSDQVENRAHWPLVNDRLSCVTCHTFTDHCRSSPVRPSVHSRFLRGDGSGGTTFCATCHTAATAPRHNPHRMIGEGGAVIESSCGLCHGVTMPSGEQAVRGGRRELHADELTLCGACHRRHVDFFEPGHLGSRVSPAMLDALSRAAESVEPVAGKGSGTDVARTELASTASLFLPLDPAGRVVCSTCHNPHEVGVFPEGNSLARGAMTLPRSPGAPVPTRVAGAALCSACHAGTMGGAGLAAGERAVGARP